jgi:hypothetical protein
MEPVPREANSLEPAQLLDILAQANSQSSFYAHAAKFLDVNLAPEWGRLPEATPRGPARLLTIGMATYDDYDGVYFSVQAIRMYHPEAAEAEILVLDNHPEGPCAGPLKQLEKFVAGYRYVPVIRPRGTAVRDLLFREAAGEWVLSMDSHVMFAPGALGQLVEYLEANPATRDLLQGPLLSDNLSTGATHFDPVWSAGMWGVWGRDARGADPSSPAFEIPMQGLGVFACRRDAWPGLNPRLSGFGGEEGYLHEKIRRAGGRTLCLPFLRWTHRFQRPFGVRYHLSWEDRVRNYLIGFTELGLDVSPVVEHFETQLGKEPARAIAERVRREMANPFFFFDAIYCINLDRAQKRWEDVSRRFEALGIAHRVRRFAAIETPSDHHIGCALSHRAILAEAKAQGLHNVLVFEDDVLFSPNAAEELRRAVNEIERRSWATLYLGGHRWGQSFETVPGCQYLEQPHGLTCTHAIAYHESIFDRVLSDVPATPSAAALWLRQHHGIDQYYARSLDGLHLVTNPVIAAQASILGQEERTFRG